ncbi:MAG: GNAT family N-acetyltransferase [Myxococcaceae bacterium]|nr:GNAT family N-acetyltransferase [Myxococcaceae bacterium]
MDGRTAPEWVQPPVVAAPRVVEVEGRAAFVALEAEWNALVRETDDQIFYRHEFIRVWVDNFAPTARLRVLTLRAQDGTLQAVLPLIERRTRMYGVPLRELCAAANLHSCRFDLIARDPKRAAEAFFDHLVQDRSWDLIRLTDVPEGGKAFALLAHAAACGHPTGVWQSLQSPYIPLPDTPAALMDRLDSKFKANLRRRRKRLEEKGRVTFERVEGGAQLAAFLEEGLRLEQSGWKGRGGTAIAQDEATRGFYSELARNAEHLGVLALWFMRLDGRAVGFHYALQYAGRYLLLKPAYDEAIRECSPGQLLMEEVVKDCIGRGLPEFDFLGPDMPWKRDWTDHVRPHFWLYVFRRSPKGRALREAKFRWIPAIKERVATWKR